MVTVETGKLVERRKKKRETSMLVWLLIPSEIHRLPDSDHLVYTCWSTSCVFFQAEYRIISWSFTGSTVMLNCMFDKTPHFLNMFTVKVFVYWLRHEEKANIAEYEKLGKHCPSEVLRITAVKSV